MVTKHYGKDFGWIGCQKQAGSEEDLWDYYDI